MRKTAAQTEESKRPERSFAEGADYYFENGLMVLTEAFLRRRGSCCGNGCRHCPYDRERVAAQCR